ncbi:hypothetical protein [Paracoccus ravus]|uniref:hypothetical protein n=1 Tax=Paracoccus ravus TaxID=2447760 RepID=UPI00106EBA74|nr:hypothetical protein [Paracoccus ravus]
MSHKTFLIPLLLSGSMAVSGCNDPLAQQKYDEFSKTGHLQVSAMDLIAMATPDAPAAQPAPVTQMARTAVVQPATRATTARRTTAAAPKKVAAASPSAAKRKRLVVPDTAKRQLSVEGGSAPKVVELDLMND